MKFTKFYEENGIWGFTIPEACECVVLFKPPSGGGLPTEGTLEGDVLFDLWNRAPLVNGVRQRLLLFFKLPTADPLNVARLFVARALQDQTWGKMRYWATTDAQSQSVSFPNGDAVAVQIQQVELGFAPVPEQPPKTLDNLSITWTDDRLSLKVAGSDWQVRAGFDEPVVIGQAGALLVGVAPAGGFSAGTLECAATEDVWSGVSPGIELSRVVKVEGTEFRRDTVVYSDFLQHRPTGIGGALVGLDPRDPNFENMALPRSYVRFTSALDLTTNLTDTRGLRFILSPETEGEAGHMALRLDLLGGSVVEGQWSPTVASASFAPNGRFRIRGLRGETPPPEATPTYRLLTGTTGTEFIEVVAGQSIRFNALERGILRFDEDVPPPGPPPGRDDENAEGEDELPLHSGQGLVTTSWLTVLPMEDATLARFIAEPAESALFKAPASRDDQAPLERANVRFGDMRPEGFMPVMPWAGVKPQNLRAGVDDIINALETTHLAPSRRTVVSRGAPGRRRAARDERDELGVTPQGILAKVTPDGEYVTLHFGDPQPDGDITKRIEYIIDILFHFQGEEAVFYRSFQKALRADDLFLVRTKPKAYVKRVLRPAQEFAIRNFAFKLAEGDETDTVLIIKYFRGQSLKSLFEAKDRRLWACPDDLAPDFDLNAFLNRYILIDGRVPSPLRSIWDSPSWQGVLMLDGDVPILPDLLEALRPGMVENRLRLHHSGFNALPVKSSEVQATPKRQGSSFGLVRYLGKPEEPTPDIATEDSEPRDDGETEPTDRKYTFKVRKLAVEYANSHVSKFEALVETTFTHLFWSPTPDGTILLEGTYESRRNAAGEPTEDVFSLRAKDAVKEFNFPDSILEKFIVSRAALTVTNVKKSQKGKVESLTSFLGFNGSVVFQKGFPINLFEVKQITFERLGLEFTQIKEPEHFSCKFRADTLRAEIDSSGARNSLLAALPLKLKGFRVALDKMIKLPELGYLPIFGENLTGFHFAFDLELDLGFLGKLSGPGKGLRFPLLLGWRGGSNSGIGFGIQFPNWNGTEFEIGLQQFVAVRAKRAALKRCPDAGQAKVLAIVLSEARLVFFGKEWPEDTIFDFAIFLKTEGERKLSWAFGLKPNDSFVKYLGAGQRITPPAATTAKELIKEYDNILSNAAGSDPCKLVTNGLAKPEDEGWLILANFKLAGLFEAWVGLADHNKAVYALRLEADALSGFGIEAIYRRVTDDLGIFSAEVSGIFPPIQVGAATMRLPAIRVEVHTDGGFLVDLGFPWKNDFTRSFQFELLIFLGSGGFYFGRTSAAAVTALAMDHREFGFGPPDLNSLKKFRALRAGMCFRVGIGRSIDLGLLRGEASVTVFSGLEGVVTYSGAASPSLYWLTGKIGLMVHIWAEVRFVILTARVDICVYVMVGFEMRRVLGKNDAGEHHILTLPAIIFAEVGVYVRLELKIKIGCVQVTVVCEFSKTWRFEQPIGDFSSEGPITFDADGRARALPARKNERSRKQETYYRSHHWATSRRDVREDPEELPLYATILPCAALPADVTGGTATTPYQPCAVVQLSLIINSGFRALAEFLIAQILNITPDAATPVPWKTVHAKRDAVRDPATWSGDEVNDLLEVLQARFAPDLRNAAIDLAMPEPPAMAVVPLWPKVSWRYRQDERQVRAQAVRLSGTNRAAGRAEMPADIAHFVDYLRALTQSAHAEIERTIERLGRPVDGQPEDAVLGWGTLWEELANGPDRLLRSLAQDLNRSLLHGARKPNGLGQPRPATVLTGQQAAASKELLGRGIEVLLDGTAQTTLVAQEVESTFQAVQYALTMPTSTPGQHSTVPLQSPGNEYFDLTPDPGVPTWTYHQRAMSLPERPSPEDFIVSSGRRFLRQPSSILREADSELPPAPDPTATVEFSLCRAVERAVPGTPQPRLSIEPLEATDWSPALLLRTRVDRAWAPSEAPYPVFEIKGIPQDERWYLDQLGLLAGDDGTGGGELPPDTGVRLWLEWEPDAADDALVTRERREITDWVLTRRNLTGLARPGEESFFRRRGAPALPFSATQAEAKETLQLLQMASITNTGGYFLRAVLPADLPLSSLPGDRIWLAISVKLKPQPVPGRTSQTVSLAANALEFADAFAIEALLVRFESRKHISLQPFAPPGTLAFGWRRTIPPFGEMNTSAGFAQSVHLIDYEVRDAAGPIDSYMEVLAMGGEDAPPVLQWEREQCAADAGPALSPLKSLAREFADGGGRRDAETPIAALSLDDFAGPNGTTASPDDAKYWFYRTTVRYAYEGLYARLADPARRNLTVQSGFRDIFGNRIAPAFEQQEKTLCYTDPLLPPGEWPFVSMQVVPTASNRLLFQARFHKPEPSEEEKKHKVDVSVRRKLLLALEQLRGAADEVSIGLSDFDVATGRPVDPTTRFHYRETGTPTIRQALISLLEKASVDPFPAEAVLVEAVVEVAAPARFSQPSLFVPALVVRRTAFLPPAEMLPGGQSPEEKALRDAIARQIEQACALMPLRNAPFVVGEEPPPAPEFQMVAEAFEDVLTPAAGVKAALRRNRFNEHELWFVPAVSLPTVRAGAPVYASARPLSTVRGADTFTVPEFDPNGPPEGTLVVGQWTQGFPLVGNAGFQKQDYDGLARGVFGFFEGILTPREITLGAEQPVWRQILATKLQLARTLGDPSTSFLVPIFADETPAKPGLKRMATDAFERNLSAFYAVDTVAQFPVLLPPLDAGKINYYGQIEAGIDTPAGPPPLAKPTYSDFVLSAAFDASSESDRSARLTLLYDMAPSEEDRWRECLTQSITARITHLQLPVPGDAPAHEFDLGQWLKLARPADLALKAGGDPLQIPVIKRAFPAEPSIEDCRSLQPAVSPEHLADWQWQITYLAEKSNADRLFFDIAYNVDETPPPVSRANPARREDTIAWEPANLLQALIALDRLSVHWAKLRAGSAASAANALNAANVLLTSLAAQLVKTRRASREQPVVDKFIYAVRTGGPDEEEVKNADNPRVQKAIMAKDNTAPNALMQKYTFTSELNSLTLFGPEGAVNYRPAISLKRNDDLDDSGARSTNPVLVYECGPVLWNTAARVTNLWPHPISFPPTTGSLTAALEDALGKIFHGADVSQLAARVDLWHIFENGPMRAVDPPAIFSVDTRFLGVHDLADKIVQSYQQALSPYGQALAVLRELTAPRLRIRLQVSQPSAGQTISRLLLDITALEFDLSIITSI